jgi:hypothetical protein
MATVAGYETTLHEGRMKNLLLLLAHLLTTLARTIKPGGARAIVTQLHPRPEDSTRQQGY